MSILWLTPAAWTALALIAIPLLIHLLARQRSRRVPFPSLRFVPASQLAALRRRMIVNWPLLIIRILIIACAVAAVAGPVLISNARRVTWERRVARAIVVTDDSPEVAELAQQEARGSFVNARFAEARLADGIRAAADWLEAQPPAARELVIIGDLREGVLARRDLDLVGSHVGVRFLPLPIAAASSRAELRATADDDGRVGISRVVVEPEARETRASYVEEATGRWPDVRVTAREEQQGYADALLRAVLREGVLFDPDIPRSITIQFEGAPLGESPVPPKTAWMRHVLEQNPQVRGGEVGPDLVVSAAMAVTDASAPAIVAGVLRSALAPSLDDREPRQIAPALLARWSRPSTPSPTGAPPAEEGDRRWLWGATLLLLGLEQVIRGRTRGE